MKIAAIVVTYHPELKLLNENISAFINHVDKLLIWQNCNTSIQLPAEALEKAHFIGFKSNSYIAKPLNEALNWCKSNGYDYLLMMDQDSLWEDFAKFLKIALSDKSYDTIIYAPKVNHQFENPRVIEFVESVITSGSLIDVNKALKIGGFREDYKIYWVDGEFCERAHRNGFKIALIPQCTMQQQFGHESKTSGGFMAANYSPIVYYF